jgi:hypothetical protein
LPNENNQLFLRLVASLSNNLLPTSGPENGFGNRLEFRRAQAGELHAATGLILSADRPAGSAQISEFLQSAAERRIDPSETWVAAYGDKIVFAALPVPSPGRTMLILVPGEISQTAALAASRLVNELCGRFAREGVHLAQVLLDPERMGTRKFFESHSFIEMAELIYLHGYAPRLAPAPSLDSRMSWKHYDDSTHELFSRGILASYQESFDCPQWDAGYRGRDRRAQGYGRI